MRALIFKIFSGAALLALSTGIMAAALPLAAEKAAPLETIFVKKLATQLGEKMGLPAALFQIQVESFSTVPAWSNARVDSLQILSVGAGSFRRVDGLFQAPLIVQSAGKSTELLAQGLIKVIGPTYVARHSLLRGQNIGQDDLNQIILPWKMLPTGVAGESWMAFVGRRVKGHVDAGQPIALEALEEAVAVQNGDMVELTLLSGPGVMIRSRAIAKQEGRVGDMIRLEQPDTKKIITGSIVGQKSVEVRL